MAEEALPTPPASPVQVIVENFNKLTPRQKMAGAALIALSLSLLVGIWLWSKQPQYSVLFSGLDEKDGGAIVTALQQQNVPYRVEAGGSAIYVPAERANELRLTLAANGLPRGSSVGFELLETQKLGVSQFHEQIDYQRALEGELARTIQSLSAVAGARVHLAIPKQNAFLRNEQKPTASVVVNLHPGRFLELAQIAGIVHLVSSSVPQLAASQISVIDQQGNLLTRNPNPDGLMLDDSQIKYVRNLEDNYIERIGKILDPVLGEGNFRAQVMADVDFDRAEQTSETYRPNPAPDTAIRSQQSNESQTNQPGPQGVPGALTNQPPVPATAPITVPAVPGQAQQGQQGQAALPISSNRSTTTNYELDKTIQHVKRATGQVRRLSVAVVVNHRPSRDARGNVTSAPLGEDEVRKINDLVREAVGYSEQRGDSITVTNAAFTLAEKSEAPPLPFLKDPENIELIKEVARWLALLLVAFIIYRKVILPLVRTVAPPPPPPAEAEEPAEPTLAQDGEGSDEEDELDGDISPEVLELELAKMSFEKKLARAREVAKKDPKMVAQLIKEWMGGGGNGEGR
ncbi:MAG: flagellar M-ring protein FliF [Candidatus Dactylopiibacterium carminicum]|uniref:Flagellar M-ring protein n=1 Tax=Candidatus Dactylopiibacterium carminicum TaxID=857335 RepID=A0A272ER23_9RHOO|nr:flagellar basal-body MS-ring/collar protein FliF [Candidatus Dactylopiibacterium carminicum]KAF7598673.1 flagellar basal body M-ring protein FliF [Candidatus Dactylopiibacterium carminicum]PAS92563.1 MAG: flagellar M-ring protein FliF [Candidatus Dactylopiibacterium carminicum]PAS96078.1 MAG: flagellar M-ring protein FliF [Candidatus Dactylopiibacterium carminicum]PAS98541.1 MAG: flagellar M-ring protein FliF [Candidatus Dactylopiibacterium carminicum]